MSHLHRSGACGPAQSETGYQPDARQPIVPEHPWIDAHRPTPHPGWRDVAVRETKTKFDWAAEMARLLEGRYADCERVILVCDNLNTHTKGRSTKRSSRNEHAS